MTTRPRAPDASVAEDSDAGRSVSRPSGHSCGCASRVFQAYGIIAGQAPRPPRPGAKQSPANPAAGPAFRAVVRRVVPKQQVHPAAHCASLGPLC